MSIHQQPPTPDGRRLAARELARAKREAMARRAARIRRFIAAGSVALFVAAFLVVYVQLASGHDPALVANAKRKAASGSAAGKAKSTLSKTGTGGSGSSGSSSSGESGTASSTESEAGSSSESETGSSSGSGASSSSESGASSASESETPSSGESESSSPSSVRTGQS